MPRQGAGLWLYRAGLGAIPGGSRLCPSASRSSARPRWAHNEHSKEYPKPTVSVLQVLLSLPPLSAFSPALPSSPLSYSGAQPFFSSFPLLSSFFHHPHHLHQLIHGASPCPPPLQPLFQSSQGSPALFLCARAPGTAPNCSSQVTDWHFWGQSDLHNTCGQEGATDGFGNPTTPCSKGSNTENSGVTPGITWELGRDVPLDLSRSTPEGPSRFAAP